MNFTLEERTACLLVLMALADCDGRRNNDEIDVLLRCNKVLGITHEDMLAGIINKAHLMPITKVESIIKPMDATKKYILEQCMVKIMEADGPANEKELSTWWGIQMQLNLPRWQSVKNNN